MIGNIPKNNLLTLKNSCTFIVVDQQVFFEFVSQNDWWYTKNFITNFPLLFLSVSQFQFNCCLWKTCVRCASKPSAKCAAASSSMHGFVSEFYAQHSLYIDIGLVSRLQAGFETTPYSCCLLKKVKWNSQFILSIVKEMTTFDSTLYGRHMEFF